MAFEEYPKVIYVGGVSVTVASAEEEARWRGTPSSPAPVAEPQTEPAKSEPVEVVNEPEPEHPKTKPVAHKKGSLKK